MTKSSVFRSGRSGGIKPLNAPRVVYVRTDSAGNPVAVQVPPAITSPRGRRTARDPHPNPRLAPGVRGALGRRASTHPLAPSRRRGNQAPGVRDASRLRRDSAGLAYAPKDACPPGAKRELEGGSVRRVDRSTSPSTTRKARELRHNATPAENLLWKHLRKTQVEKYKFTRQHPIGPYFVDFCCRPARLVIELDGGQHATQQEADADRQQYLEAQGYRVIRFWNNEVFENLEGVLFRIVEALAATNSLASDAHNPHPNPLPSRERGFTPPSAPDGTWVKVTGIEDLWKVNDEWWRGPEEEIARLYYVIRLENSQQITVYLDLIANSWYRQAG